MDFLFKNKNLRSTQNDLDEGEPIPGFLKTEPTFSNHHEKESVRFEQSPQNPPVYHEPYSIPQNVESVPKGHVTLSLSHGGILGILFALLLLGLLFFLAGLMTGVLVSDYAQNSTPVQSAPKVVDDTKDLKGDDNV